MMPRSLEADMPEPLTPQEVAVLVDLIQDQKAEIARLRSEQSLLGVLREIAIDPAMPPHIRLKAAEAGVAYETPKLSASINSHSWTHGIAGRLDAAIERKSRPSMSDRLRLVENTAESASE
jgi:hypothetical protein